MFQFPIKIPEIIFGSNLEFFLVSYPDSATPINCIGCVAVRFSIFSSVFFIATHPTTRRLKPRLDKRSLPPQTKNSTYFQALPSIIVHNRGRASKHRFPGRVREPGKRLKSLLQTILFLTLKRNNQVTVLEFSTRDRFAS